MTDREFRRLKRSDLVEIIYQLQKDMESLCTENKELWAENERLRAEDQETDHD